MASVTVSKMIHFAKEIKDVICELYNAYYRNRKKYNEDISFGLASMKMDLSLIIASIERKKEKVLSHETDPIIKGLNLKERGNAIEEEKRLDNEHLERIRDKPFILFIAEEKTSFDVYLIMKKFVPYIKFGKEGYKRLLGNSRLKSDEKEIIGRLGPLWENFHNISTRILDVLDNACTDKETGEKCFKATVLKSCSPFTTNYERLVMGEGPVEKGVKGSKGIGVSVTIKTVKKDKVVGNKKKGQEKSK